MGFVTVVGGANLDIGGRPASGAMPGDSNPGVVTLSPGGVGRNIAHDLALLGSSVRLLTVYGEDDQARALRASCKSLGIDDRLALVVPGGRTSTYLYITDTQGDMALAVNDMAILERLSPEVLAERMEELNRSAAVVLDANLPEESIRYLAERCTAPLFADPVSAAKAGRLLPVLGRLHTLKPNRLEAELLTGIAVQDLPSAKRAARSLLARNVRRVFLSLGGDGVLAAEGETLLHLPGLPADIRNTTGAGDAFMAAVVWSYGRGLSLRDTARAGLAAAALTMESELTNSPQLSERTVRQYMARCTAENAEM